MSSALAVLSDVFHDVLQIYCFFADEFLPEFFVGDNWKYFDVRRSSCFMSSKSQFFSSVISFSQCSSGVSISSCFAQKKISTAVVSSSLGIKYSRNNCNSLPVLI